MRKRNKLIEDPTKTKAIAIITYNQILHCYNHIKAKGINNN